MRSYEAPIGATARHEAPVLKAVIECGLAAADGAKEDELAAGGRFFAEQKVQHNEQQR